MSRARDRRSALGGRLIGLVLALWLVGPAGRADAAEPQAVRIALVRGAGSGPLYIAVAEGHFAREGLDARLDFLASDALVAAAVASGKDDLGMASLDASFFAYAGRHGLKFIATQFSDRTGFPANAFLISGKAYDAGFRGVQDLPGKRIGMTTAGAGVRYSLEGIARRYRLDPGTMKLVWLKTEAGEVAALSRGEIDAAILPYARALQLRSAGKGAFILRLSDLYEWQEGVVFARAQTIDAHRPLVEGFMRAYRRGVADYDLTFQQRGDEGDVIPGPRYAQYLGLIARQAKLTPRLLERTMPYCDHLARLDVADIDRQLEFWQGEGLVDRRVDAALLLDLSFIDAHIGAPPRAN